MCEPINKPGAITLNKITKPPESILLTIFIYLLRVFQLCLQMFAVINCIFYIILYFPLCILVQNQLFENLTKGTALAACPPKKIYSTIIYPCSLLCIKKQQL